MNRVPGQSSANEVELEVEDKKYLDSQYAKYEGQSDDQSVESRDTNGDKSDLIADLALKICLIDERLEQVEAKLLSGTLDKVSFKKKSNSPGKISSPLDSGQITCRARNEGIFAEMQACFRVLKEHRFAACQSLLLVTIVTAVVSFAIVLYSNVDESNDSLYKPIKIAGHDDFYLNEELEYTIPKHYFLMHMRGRTQDIPTLYNNSRWKDSFNENCGETVASCLAAYMNHILTDPDDPGITASCDMVAADEETGLFANAKIELRNLSFYVDEIGTASLSGTDLGIFGVLWKLEFDALETHMTGPLYCSIELDITKMDQMLPEFLLEIYFMVSRTHEDSGLTGASDYIDSWSKLWRWDDILSKNFVYVYDESTLDTQSRFQAEIYVERRVLSSLETSLSRDTLLTIDTYPNPTIVHYVSYDNYTYMNWLADMGGFLSIAVGFFLFSATRVTKLAHRGQVFHTHHGILPIFSLPHRNAEELARLRFIVLESLGVTEVEYFGNAYQKKLTNRIQNINSN